MVLYIRNMYFASILILSLSCTNDAPREDAIVKAPDSIAVKATSEKEILGNIKQYPTWKIVSFHPSSEITAMDDDKASTFVGKSIQFEGLKVAKNDFSKACEIQFTEARELKESDFSYYLGEFSKKDKFKLENVLAFKTNCEIPLNEFYYVDSYVIINLDGYFFKAKHEAESITKQVPIAQLPLDDKSVKLIKFDLDFSLLPNKEFIETPYYAVLPSIKDITIFIVKYQQGDSEKSFLCTAKDSKVIDSRVIEDNDISYEIDNSYSIKLNKIENDEMKLKEKLSINAEGKIK